VLNEISALSSLRPAVTFDRLLTESSMITRIKSRWALVLGMVMFMTGNLLWAGPVNINTADAETLARELKGVGLKRAQAIIEYRQKHGPFKTVDELALVKGIGPAAIAKNRALIRLDGQPVSKGAQNPVAPTPARR
jgi:competence protein ComEA